MYLLARPRGEVVVTITDKSWTCDIHGSKCKVDAWNSWTCKVEGIQISACSSCWADWQTSVRADPALTERCPKCTRAPARVPTALRIADKNGTSVTRAKEPLRGVIADAIETAMHKEGVLADVRTRVMFRLATEEPWMNLPDPATNANPATPIAPISKVG
jgi:hypothetical protein